MHTLKVAVAFAAVCGLLVACGDDDTGSGGGSGPGNGATSNGTTNATSNGTTGGDDLEAIAYPLGKICTFQREGGAEWTYTYSDDSLDYEISRGPWASDPQLPQLTDSGHCVRVSWDAQAQRWSGYRVWYTPCEDATSLTSRERLEMEWGDDQGDVVDLTGIAPVEGAPLIPALGVPSSATLDGATLDGAPSPFLGCGSEPGQELCTITFCEDGT